MIASRGTAAWRVCGAMLLALACATSACSKESKSSEKPAVEPLPAEEVTRGRKACETYVARVCECAKSHTDLADECALSKARPEAFELNLNVIASEGLSKIEVQAAKVEARKIAAACFEADARLEVSKCPRAGM